MIGMATDPNGRTLIVHQSGIHTSIRVTIGVGEPLSSAIAAMRLAGNAVRVRNEQFTEIAPETKE